MVPRYEIKLLGLLNLMMWIDIFSKLYTDVDVCKKSYQKSLVVFEIFEKIQSGPVFGPPGIVTISQ